MLLPPHCRPRGRFDKWMAICWGISLATLGLIVALYSHSSLCIEPEESLLALSWLLKQ